VNVIELKNIVKRYQQFLAVDHVSFSVPEGRIFGMLGPNGAGKTSTIRMITVITKADEGEIRFMGEPLSASHRELIGYMPEERGLYKKMKVGEHLLYLARLKGLTKKEANRRIENWYQKFNISDWHNKKIEELSKGMQQKIQFIATVIHEPKLLILDEPFSGLDPVNTNLIRDEIDEMHKNGTTILFSTHRMEQVEQICQDIVLINKGRNVLQGTVADVRQQFKENLFRFDYEGDLPNTLLDSIELISNEAGQLIVKLPMGMDSNTFLRYLLDQQVHIVGFKEILPTLNEIFIKVVKEPSHE
jgi:ABC-2 type transport system ATP-binding protein